MSEHWSIEGKTFLITGAASGLGAKYAETFLKEGAQSIAILDIDEKVGNATAEKLNELYPNKVVFIECDVSCEENIETAFKKVLTKFKQIDVVINNAGVMVDSPSLWRTACNVNWQGLVSFTMKGVKHMRKDEGGAGGTIVNVSSTAALTKFPFMPIYNGAKLAVLHFTQCLAMDPFYSQTGVRLLTICFGPTDTPLLQGLENRTYDSNLGKIFAKTVEELNVQFQKVGFAVAAMLDMYQKGPPGSIWLSVDNEPVVDITSTIDRAFREFETVIMKTGL